MMCQIDAIRVFRFPRKGIRSDGCSLSSHRALEGELPFATSYWMEQPTGWRRFAPRDFRSVAGSVLVHAAVIAALVLNFDPEIKPKDDLGSLITISLASPGDGAEKASPSPETKKVQHEAEKEASQEVHSDADKNEADKELPPQLSDQKTIEETKAREAEASETSADASKDAIADATKIGGEEGTIWTPPAPDPNGSELGGEEMRRETRVAMPVVDLPKGASSPVLLSYDQGRYSDAEATREAARLTNAGTIIMAVSVNDKGEVGDCVVTVTSGSNLLDERACLLIKSYRYRPAQDARGRAHGAIVVEILEWARDGNFSGQSAPELAANPLQVVRNQVNPLTGPAGRLNEMPMVQMPKVGISTR